MPRSFLKERDFQYQKYYKMGYTPKRQIRQENRINWSLVIFCATIVFLGSIFLGRWLGEKLLSTRTAIKTPPSVSDVNAGIPRIQKQDETPSSSNETRQNVTPPTLVVPPPTLEPGAKASTVPYLEQSETTTKEDTDNSDSTNTEEKSDTPELNKDKSEQNSTSSFRVQAGLFAGKDNAQKLSDELTQKGYTTQVEATNVSGQTVFRVYIGPYKNREEADTTVEKLTNLGYPAFILQPEH